MGRIPVAADSRSHGTFAAPVSFLAGAGGPGRIEIVDVERGDGSAHARVSVQVLLESTEAARRTVPQQPAPPPIVLETPVTGAAVGASIELRGWISTVPFENNLTYRVYSEGGAVIDRGWIMVEGNLGERGTFAKSITLPSTQTADPVRIEVRDVDEADGSLFTSTTVQVWVVLPSVERWSVGGAVTLLTGATRRRIFIDETQPKRCSLSEARALAWAFVCLEPEIDLFRLS